MLWSVVQSVCVMICSSNTHHNLLSKCVNPNKWYSAVQSSLYRWREIFSLLVPAQVFRLDSGQEGRWPLIDSQSNIKPNITTRPAS